MSEPTVIPEPVVRLVGELQIRLTMAEAENQALREAEENGGDE